MRLGDAARSRRDADPRRRLRRAGVALAAMLFWGGSAGLAAAYLSAGGSGAGSATANPTTAAVTLTAATPTAALYPGGSTAVSLRASNPNNYPVRITTLALDASQGSAGLAVDAAHSSCGLSTLSFPVRTTAAPAGRSPPRAS